MNDMMTRKVFYSNILMGGGVTHPESLEIDGEYIRYEKRSYLRSTRQSVTFPMREIIAFETYPRLNGVNLIIRTQSRSITCHGLSRKSAYRIKKLIQRAD